MTFSSFFSFSRNTHGHTLCFYLNCMQQYLGSAVHIICMDNAFIRKPMIWSELLNLCIKIYETNKKCNILNIIVQDILRIYCKICLIKNFQRCSLVFTFIHNFLLLFTTNLHKCAVSLDICALGRFVIL